MVAAEVDPERLVFVDEMGVHTSLAPLYGYSSKGERVRLQVPRNRGRNTTLLASITLTATVIMVEPVCRTREILRNLGYVLRAVFPTEVLGAGIYSSVTFGGQWFWLTL